MSQTPRVSIAAKLAVQVISIGLLAVLAGQKLVDQPLVSELLRWGAGCLLVLVALNMVAVVRDDGEEVDARAPRHPRLDSQTAEDADAAPLPQVPRGQRMAAAHRQRFRGAHGA